MAVYSVSIRWTPKGCRKRRGSFGYVLANSREEAIEKFKSEVYYPTDLRLDIMAYEVEREVFGINYT